MPAPKRICSCGCGRLVSKSTEERHRAGIAPTHILATQLLDGLRSACPPVSTAPRPSKRQRTEALGITIDNSTQLPSISDQFGAQSAPQDPELSASFHAGDFPGDTPQTDPSNTQEGSDEELASGPEELAQPALYRPRVLVSDDSDEDEGEDRNDDVDSDSEIGGLGEHGDGEGIYDYYGTVDEMAEAFEQELSQIGAWCCLVLQAMC